MVDLSRSQALPSITSGEARMMFIDNIDLPEDRAFPVTSEKVKEMEASIENFGLLQEIGIRRSKTDPTRQDIIWGAHRFSAWRNKWHIARTGDDDKEKGRWQTIPCLVFSEKMSDDQCKLAELEENLARGTVSPAQRKVMAGESMKLAKKVFKKGTSERKGTGVPGTPAYTPPTQAECAELCGVAIKTIKKWYREFRKDHDDVNWNKQSEENYDAFCEWLKIKGEAEAEEKARKSELAEATKLEKAEAEARKALHAYADLGGCVITLAKSVAGDM